MRTRLATPSRRSPPACPPQDVVYSGTNLDRRRPRLPARARRLASTSTRSISCGTWCAAAAAGSVGLRFLIDDPAKRNRIGVSPRELPEALRIAEAGGVRVAGLHMYAGTNNRRPSRFLGCVDRLLAAAETLPDLEYVNLGGGYGIGYREGEPDLDVDAIGREVARRLQWLSHRRGRAIRLIVEPGRFLVASAGTLLMTVVSVKHRGGRRFVGVDSTVGNIVVPSVYHGYHRIEALAPRGRPLDRPPTSAATRRTRATSSPAMSASRAWSRATSWRCATSAPTRMPCRATSSTVPVRPRCCWTGTM